ncbi:MAG TPA: CpXC domain-containing protein [Anaerolineaceae bacterium]|nr:CpXC domain-containing protein [Anaerolineaceae bacterium]HQH84660.1 CpXC domain-containing protein [Anaerolineaceae bacterium]
MSQTRTACPRCRTPLLAEVEQVVDVAVDPQAKQRLLSGSLNVIECQNCGYSGMLATPLVYHDPEKELLLTYFPPELGLPINEQERVMGPLISQVVNRLPAEKRKAYLLRPQLMLTFETLINRVLEADGITREMIEDQQKRLNLLRRLLSTTQSETRVEIIKQEEALIDENFFALLGQIGESAVHNNEQQMAQALMMLQQELLENTELGRKLKERAEETQAAIQSLQAASQAGLTREKLLDLIVEAPTETRRAALVGMARSGLDYQFFQILSDRIEAAAGPQREQLTALRDQLLEMTKAIDAEVQTQVQAAEDLLNSLVTAENIEAATEEHLPEFNDFFINVLKAELQAAQQKGDQARLEKLQRVVMVLQHASARPEMELVEKLVSAGTDEARRTVLQANAEMVTPEFLEILNRLAVQSEAEGQQPEIVAALQAAYRSAMRFSMEQKFKQNQGWRF